MLIERESGPDQLATAFKDFEQMKQQILQARAMRTPSKYRTTLPQSRPETPEVIHGVSANSSNLQDEEHWDEVILDRPDTPSSLAGLQIEKTADSQLEDSENKMDLTMATQVLPHVIPVAFNEDDPDTVPDLLEEAQSQFNEEQMHLEHEEDESDEQLLATPRPDSPRVTEVETHVRRQRPEFTVVDEVIPTFTTGMTEQDRHPELPDAANSLVTDVDDVQSALPRDLLKLDEEDEEKNEEKDTQLPVDPKVDASPDKPKLKGWRRWFK
ncbi:MAG: hypothetical protein JKX85_16045 [Phycisphaeraceae bacterium]|nr:hypothetical protein [Phycisphaeraceae bacterium]